MKKLLIITLLFSHISSFAFDDGSDKIIKKYLKAIGGAKEWEGVNTLKIVRHIDERSSYVHMDNISIVKEKAYKQEYIINQGTPTIVCVSENSGWYVSNDNMGSGSFENKIKPLPEKSFKLYKWLSQYPWCFIDYEAKGYKLSYKRDVKISVDNTSEIEMISSTGDTTHYFFDKKTALLIKSAYKNIEINHSDYKTIGSVKIPHNVVFTRTDYSHPNATRPVPLMTFYIIDQVKLNEPMDESIFMKPKQ
jgi:hypothetical protein